MTKFVTDTEALILSCLSVPQNPLEWAKVRDSFDRCVARLELGGVELGIEDACRTLVGADGDAVFGWTALLRDGTAGPQPLPPEWGGRVKSQIANAFLQIPWYLEGRHDGWGVPAPFTSIVEIEAGALSVQVKVPVVQPMIDPALDRGAPDGDDLLRVAPWPGPPWDGLFTPWECLDAFFVSGLKNDPGPEWLRRRTRRIVCARSRVWHQLRGLRDADDPALYEGMWSEPITIMVFEGWPAYFAQILGKTANCAACGRRMGKGSSYCGQVECDRMRATSRKRNNRAYSKRLAEYNSKV